MEKTLINWYSQLIIFYLLFHHIFASHFCITLSRHNFASHSTSSRHVVEPPGDNLDISISKSYAGLKQRKFYVFLCKTNKLFGVQMSEIINEKKFFSDPSMSGVSARQKCRTRTSSRSSLKCRFYNDWSKKLECFIIKNNFTSLVKVASFLV